MKKSSKFVFALAGLAVLCVCAAMAAPMAAGEGAGRGGMMQDGSGAQVVLEKLQANGVDTTELETALENGDREAVRAFLQENRPADAPAMNEDRPAMNEERVQEMITKMQANGVDTTELETALENGDNDAVRAFLQENRPADAPAMNEDRPAMNEERVQEMVAKMQANGIDTTALENGDNDAVRAFLQENRPADASAMNEDRPAMNEERVQAMVAKMQANGIDTPALETALENGDREAVRAFLQENRPADAGTGLRHGGPSAE